MATKAHILAWVSAVIVVGCAPGRPPMESPLEQGQRGPPAAARKTITIGVLDGVKTYGHL